MNRIFKYELEPNRRQVIQMPRNARPLHVCEQQQKLVMYAEVPQSDEWTEREEAGRKDMAALLDREYVDPYAIDGRIFVVVTTGDTFQAEGKTYVGTAMLGKDGPWFVAHVYEQDTDFKDPIDNRNVEDFKQIKQELSV